MQDSRARLIDRSGYVWFKDDAGDMPGSAGAGVGLWQGYGCEQLLRARESPAGYQLSGERRTRGKAMSYIAPAGSSLAADFGAITANATRRSVRLGGGI